MVVIGLLAALGGASGRAALEHADPTSPIALALRDELAARRQQQPARDAAAVDGDEHGALQRFGTERVDTVSGHKIYRVPPGDNVLQYVHSMEMMTEDEVSAQRASGAATHATLTRVPLRRCAVRARH